MNTVLPERLSPVTASHTVASPASSPRLPVSRSDACANNGGSQLRFTGVIRLICSRGQPIPPAVTIPGPGGTGSSPPTGVATNATNGFVISSGTGAGPATELFATEDGTIAGWNNSVDHTHAVVFEQVWQMLLGLTSTSR